MTPLLTTALSLSAHAQWTAEQQEFVQRYNSATLKEGAAPGNPFAAMAWDQLQLRLKKFAIPQPQPVPIRSSEFRNQKCVDLSLPTFFWQADQSPSASLVVYLPGMFEDQTDPDTLTAVRILLADHNDVLVIPNPLSDTYLDSHPIASPTDFAAEAGIILEASTRFAQARNYSKVHLVGASYGAFLASIVVARDRARIFAPPTTLMFPPLDITYSINILDGLIRKWQNNEFGAEALVGLGFQQGLFNLLHRMQNNFFYGCPRPYSNLVQKNMTLMEFMPDQLVGLNMTKVQTDFVSVNQSYFGTEKGQLSFWLNQAHDEGVDQFRILTTDDDVLNRKGAALHILPWLDNSEHVLIRHSGGHAGIIATDWFNSFGLSIMKFQ